MTRLLAGVSANGELPDLEAARQWVERARADTDCEILYEPLGYHDQADVTAPCDGERVVRRVTAPGQAP